MYISTIKYCKFFIRLCGFALLFYPTCQIGGMPRMRWPRRLFSAVVTRTPWRGSTSTEPHTTRTVWSAWIDVTRKAGVSSSRAESDDAGVPMCKSAVPTYYYTSYDSYPTTMHTLVCNHPTRRHGFVRHWF